MINAFFGYKFEYFKTFYRVRITGGASDISTVLHSVYCHFPPFALRVLCNTLDKNLHQLPLLLTVLRLIKNGKQISQLIAKQGRILLNLGKNVIKRR